MNRAQLSIRERGFDMDFPRDTLGAAALAGNVEGDLLSRCLDLCERLSKDTRADVDGPSDELMGREDGGLVAFMLVGLFNTHLVDWVCRTVPEIPSWNELLRVEALDREQHYGIELEPAAPPSTRGQTAQMVDRTGAGNLRQGLPASHTDAVA